MRRILLATVILAYLVHAQAPARASSSGPFLGPVEGNFFLIGVNLGAVFEDGDGGLLLGGEMSVAHLGRSTWYGGYFDGLRDIDHEATRLGVGVEGGYTHWGLDAGGLIDRQDGELHAGARVRAVFTLGVASVCAGPVVRFGVPDDDRYAGELSLLVKFPVRTDGSSVF